MRLKQKGKRFICIILAVLLLMPLNLQQVFAAEQVLAAESEVSTVKASVTDFAKKNYFSYMSYDAYGNNQWTKNEDESYIDLGESNGRAEECYYEIHFQGNAISVFAIKAPAHGKVRFTVDGAQEKTVDLYNSSRTAAQSVYSADNLTEGKHVLKAVTLNEKSGSKIVNQVSYAEVAHLPYPKEMGGTIVDTDLQYTQNRYSEVEKKNVFSASLSAWKNDKATSELVIFSKECSLNNVRVEASDLVCGSNTIAAENVAATFIKSTKAYNGTYLGYGDINREVPAETATNRSESSDILYQKGGSVNIGLDKLQPVWVEFNIPKDAKAGAYTGTLTVRADDIAEPIVFTYTVKVADIVLPDAETFADTFDIELWQYPYSSAEYYNVTPFSKEHLKIMESSMLKYKEIGGHAVTATILEEAWNGQTYSKNDVHYPSMIRWTKNADGSFSYDYTDFDAWVTFCKNLGIGDKIVLYSIAPWHNSFTYWEGDVLQYEKFTAGSDRYKGVWTDFLTDLIGHLEEKGWFDESYIGIDERGFTAAAFDMVEAVTNEDGECLKTAGAMDGIGSNRDLAMRVDDLNVGDNAAAAHAEEFAQLLKERTDAGLRTTLYSCTEHKPGNFALSAPAESYWSIVNAAKMGTAGFLRWAYDAWVEDPLRDATHNAFEPGDCFLVYPDEKDAETPVSKSSVRLERMAEGIRDVNKLLYIEKQAPEFADEIRSLYNKIETTAYSGRSYLSDAEKERLKTEVTAFKAGIARITDTYLRSTSEKEGLYLLAEEKELKLGSSYQIPVKLVTNQDDKTIIYKSKNPMAASVDQSGLVTARGIGNTEIMLRSGRFTAFLQVKVTPADRELIIKNTLTDYKLPEEYLSDVEKGPQAGERHYLGQPDMIMLDDNKTLFTVYPEGHGRGRIIMQKSTDAGESWSEVEVPSSWLDSFETPTIYKLNMTDGSTKLIVISGRPAGFGALTGGWDSSISTDNGETWSEFTTHCENLPNGARNETVVAMASLIQLKDEEGNYIDRWMGVYHDGGSFVNYKSYLTFDKDGNQQWTAPEPYLSEHRSVESSHRICEVGLFRSPDGNRIVGLARSQTHNHPATMFYSDDEGETWSRPVDLPGSLAGERHKAMYDPTDPTGQRLIVTFREIKYDLDNNNQFGGQNDWVAGDWIAWVGTYDDIMELNDGAYRILLCEDWAANPKSGDTGYSGLVVLPDGTFITDTYGHWDKEYSESLPNYDVHNDWCWIKQAKFKLSVFDEQTVPGMKAKISEVLTEAETMLEGLDAKHYTAQSWEELENALKDARSTAGADNATQASCHEALYRLKSAMYSLLAKGAESDDVPVAEIVVEPETLTFTKSGEQKSLHAAAEPARATNQAIVWASRNPNVAEVSKNGEVTAKGGGKTVITATAADGYGAVTEINVEVKIPASKPPIGKDPNPSKLTDGETKTIGKYKYKVIRASDQTLAVIGGTNKKDKSVKIEDKVTFNNMVCTVVEIDKKAFKGYTSLTSVTIGANVKKIGKDAFSGCKKLKKVTLKGKALKTIGKGAFKKTAQKMTVTAKKLTKKQKTALLKKMKKSGMSKKAKIK